MRNFIELLDYCLLSKKKTLIVIRGESGSGKTTFSRALQTYIEKYFQVYFSHHEADDFFFDENGDYNFNYKKLKDAHNQCISRLETDSSISHLHGSIVSNTFTRLWEVQSYTDKLLDKYANIICIRVEGGTGNDKGLSEEIVTKQKERYEISHLPIKALHEYSRLVNLDMLPTEEFVVDINMLDFSPSEHLSIKYKKFIKERG